MKIRDVRVESAGRHLSAIARFEWEDCDRPPVEIYFRVDESLRSDFSAAPESFLVAGYFPAMHHGERRIALVGPLCPILRDGLLGAGRLFHLWYGHTPPRIECRGGGQASEEPPSESTASFLTGGVDSLHALWRNQSLYPPGHTSRVRECLFVFGIEMPGLEDTPRAQRRLAAVWPYVERAAGDANVGVLRIDTNVRRLEPDVAFWAWEYIAPPLAAAAHLLTRRFATILLGSSYDYRNLMPWGTHPLLDPLLGSASLSIEHVGTATPRLEKLRDLLAWPVAVRGLLVCGSSPEASLNCGVCSKCIRAMAELIAVGSPRVETLPPLESLRPEQIDALDVGPIDVENFWTATLPGLARQRRPDLAEAVTRYLKRIRAVHRPKGARRWKRRFVALDAHVTGGRLLALRRWLREGSSGVAAETTAGPCLENPDAKPNHRAE